MPISLAPVTCPRLAEAARDRALRSKSDLPAVNCLTVPSASPFLSVSQGIQSEYVILVLFYSSLLRCYTIEFP
jgi:hypothetical protein